MLGAASRWGRAGLLGVVATCASAEVAAQSSPPAWGVLPADDPACVAAWLDWAVGDSEDRGLTTYGMVAAADLSAAPDRTHGSSIRIAVGVDGDAARGPVRTGVSIPAVGDAYTYSGPRTDRSAGLGARTRAEISMGRFLATADVTAHERGARTRLLGVAVRGRRVTAFAGALSLRAGSECRDGLVLGASGRAQARGVELRQGAPFELPLIGTLRVGLQVGAMREAAPGNEWPLFHSMRVELSPHPDLIVGLNRSVVFGGSQTEVDVTPRTVALMLLGITDTGAKDSDFENQVASVDLRWRARAAGTPLLTTAEYGTDDSGWAFLHVPGVRLATSVGVGTHWLGVSGTWVAGPTGSYPPWYRHGALAWGWSDRGVPVGNPLGGEVRALAATLRRTTPMTVVDVSAGVVDRGDSNVYAPDLAGVRMYGTADFLWRADVWELRASIRGDIGAPLAGRASASVLRLVG